MTGERLFQGADWDFLTLQRIHDACEEIAKSGAQTAYEILDHVSAVIPYGGFNESLELRWITLFRFSFSLCVGFCHRTTQ